MSPPMLVPAKHMPTLSEATQLADLVPAAPPATKDIPGLLSELIQLCQNEDILSFLFTEDTIEVPHLTSQNLTNVAITGSMNATRVEPDPKRKPHLGPLSDYVFGKWMFVPAFNVNQVTLGFGIHEFNYSRGDEWGGEYMMHMRSEFRFVRNESRGELLVLHELTEMNAMCLEYCRNITPTCQTRTSACLFRDKTRQTVQAGKFDLKHVLPCVDQINTIYEYRTCPTCGCDHTACRCTLQIVRSRHPFDTSSFRKNMMHRLGTYEGVAMAFCLKNSVAGKKAAIGSRTITTGGVDKDLIASMRDWAVAKYVRGTEHPLQTITGPADGDASEETESPSTENALMAPVADYENLRLWLDHDFLPVSGFPPPPLAEEDVAFESIALVEPALVEDLCEEGGLQARESVNKANDPAKTFGVQPLIDLTGEAAAQASKPPSSAEESVSSARDENNVDLVRLLKAEMRKKRNRLSAQRSNMKKKAMNDALKLELKNNKERAEMLRAKESSLRQENLRLRKSLGESAA